MKPPTIAYPGAKGRLASRLVDMMPTTGRVYLEPFAGRGNVFFAAALRLNFESWRLNDTSTASFFYSLKERGDRVCVPPRTRVEYQRQKRLFIESATHRSILLEPYLTFSGGGYRKGGFGSAHGPTPKGYAKTLRRCCALLRERTVKITALDWAKLDWNGLTSDDFVFFDPPYIDGDVRSYSSSLDFPALVRVLLQARFKWLLTEYSHPLYVNNLGKPFYSLPMQLACDGRGNRQRVECVWKNF